MHRRPRPTRGFTLAEVLMASAVLSVAVGAILTAVTTGQEQTYEALHEQRAVALAEALMEEIIALPYADPQGDTTAGPDDGEAARGDFDNADDFHGFNEEIGQVLDAAGLAYPGTFDRFDRSVSAAYGVQSVAGLGGDYGGLSVTVTVTDDRRRSWTLTRFIPEPTTP